MALCVQQQWIDWRYRWNSVRLDQLLRIASPFVGLNDTETRTLSTPKSYHQHQPATCGWFTAPFPRKSPGAYCVLGHVSLNRSIVAVARLGLESKNTFDVKLDNARRRRNKTY
jgi:hypothetical protein